MADDITLTVRVRDLSQGELSRINAQIHRLDQNIRNAGNGTNGVGQNFRRLGSDIDSLGVRMRAMTDDGALTQRGLRDLNRDIILVSQGLRNARRDGDLTRSTYRSMTRDLDLLRARMRLLSGDGNFITRLASRFMLFGGHIRNANRDAGLFRRTLAALADWGARGIARGAAALGIMTGAMGRFGERLAKLPQAMWIFLAVIALIGPAAQALGAILTTALAGGFIALGAYALKGSNQVKDAFTQMKSTLGSVLRDSALPLQDALSQGMLQVSIAARQMAPALKSAFAATAPLVKNFVGAITDLAQKAMPGVVYALQNSKQAMAGFRAAMGSIGTGFGNMMRIITQGNDQNIARAWVVLGNEIRNVLESIGEFSSAMLKSGTASLLMIGIFRLFTGALNVVSGVFQALDHLLFNIPQHLANAIAGFNKLGTSFGNSSQLSLMNITQLKDRLKEVNAEIKDQQSLLQNKNLPSPIKNQAKDNLNQLLKDRQDILSAVSAAEGDNATTVNKEADAYKNLLNAIEALAEQNRNYLDSQSAEQQAIADAQKGAKSYTHALSMNKGQLDLTTESGRKAYELLSKIASSTKDATDKAISANAPWAQVKKNWDDGYSSIVKLGHGMGLTTSQAKDLANQILGIPPSKDLVIKANTSDAITSLDAVVAAMQATPGAKTITVKALSGDAQRLLETLGFQVQRLPDGTITITAKTGSASEKLAEVQAARDALKGKSITMSAADRASGVIAAIQGWVRALTGKTITITTVHRDVMETIFTAPQGQADALRQQAQRFGGGATGGSAEQIARRGFATGGSISGQILSGPGTTTSDSILARLSRGEFVMRAAAVRKYGLHFMQAVNSGSANGLPGFASGGLSQNARDARSTISGNLGISWFGRYAGYTMTPTDKALATPPDLGTLVASLNDLSDQIKAGFSGRQESYLMRQLTIAGKGLINYDKQLYKVTQSLDSAKSKLDDLKNSASQLSSAVQSGVLSASDITKGASGGARVTVSSVMAGLTSSRDKASSFANALSTLQKRGLSKDLIQQIAEAGIDNGGLQTATALMGASSSEIKSMNSLQSQINSSAAKAGQNAANAVYGDAIKNQEKVVRALTAAQDRLQKAMLSLSRVMEKILAKAVGKKASGGVVGAAASGGLRGGLTWTGEHGPELVRLPVGSHVFSNPDSRRMVANTSWTSMLPRHSGRPISNGMGGGGVAPRPVVVHQTITLDGKVIARQIFDPLRAEIAHRGGNVQNSLGQRGR